MKNNQDHFNILRRIDKAYLNQRVLARDLGFSLVNSIIV